MRYTKIIAIIAAAIFGIACISIDASARGRGGGFRGGGVRAGGFHAGGVRAGGFHGGGYRAAGVHRGGYYAGGARRGGYYGVYRGGGYVRPGVGVGLGAAAVGAAAAAPYYYGQRRCGYPPYPPCY
jgi:hypothetical protein